MELKLTFNFGTEAITIPGAVTELLNRASKQDICVLILLSSSQAYRGDYRKYSSEIAGCIGCSESELEASVAFWRGAGIINKDGDDVAKKPAAGKKNVQTVAIPDKKPELPDELPSYTTAELNGILEKRRDSAQLIDECQRVIGKIFNPHEISVVLGLQDYLCLDSEYILVLFDHCARIGKKSLQYIKKFAFSLYDEGITDTAGLHEKLTRLEAAMSLEGEIRALFGMKTRELTTKEKKFISTWVGDFGYGLDIIKKAYEMTVDAIHEPAPAYANAILERWNKEGLRDLAAIEASQADKLPTEGSFDTNDFFEAALKRSLLDMNNKEGVK